MAGTVDVTLRIACFFKCLACAALSSFSTADQAITQARTRLLSATITTNPSQLKSGG